MSDDKIILESFFFMEGYILMNLSKYTTLGIFDVR